MRSPRGKKLGAMAARGMKRKRVRKVKRSKSMTVGVGTGRDLAEMSLDEFLEKGLSSSSEDDGEELSTRQQYAEDIQPTLKKSSSSALKPASGHLSHQLAEIDPEFYEFLQENDSELLEMSESDVCELTEGDELPNDKDIGGTEPRPLHVTSRKLREACVGTPESSGSDDDDGVMGDAAKAGGSGERVTKEMVRAWVKSVNCQSPSLASLRHLSAALHDAINGLLMDQSDHSPTYFIDDASVFNLLVVSCIRSVPHCLSYHLPRSSAASRRAHPPSALKGWSKVKTTTKIYLSDVLRLLEVLKDPSMCCALLKHMQSLAEYYICFPKLLKRLRKVLVSCWSEGESHVQVMAFVVLRRITMLQPHPALHHLLKKLYLAFVSNSKFTSAKTLPQIRFMQNCLVELLSIDPPTSYQHAFVYIRQLAIHLRTALTSGKKQAVQAVYNWQFIHCLDLWSHMLGHVTHESLHPLIYPLVQVMVGAIHLQPSARYYPLRLHIVRTLLELSSSTQTFVPVAPYLLEIFESQGVNMASHVTTGKPPNMSILLHATKQQLQSSAFQNSLLNETYELMLHYFAIYSSTIGFPELAYPSLARLRKVCKSVSFSWLRLQLKQLVEKVELVGSEITKQRSGLEFSPKDIQQVSTWEREQRDKGNAVTNLLATWNKVHQQTSHKTTEASCESASDEEESNDGTISDKPHVQEENADSSEGDTCGEEDVVEDFELSSEESD